VVIPGAPTTTIILAKDALPALAACCTVDVRAEAGGIILGKLSTR
jgi:hypothetical protein